MKIAVLIPCYNEEQTIGRVVKDFKKILPEADIYVYNNNSNDRTAETALEAGADVCSEYRQGKGNVVRSMFRNIDADYYIMVDGDDTYPAEDARKMLEMAKKFAVDMVIGDRLSTTYFKENKRMFHGFGNKIVRMLINKIFNSNLKDIMTGYRCFSRFFVKSFPVVSRGFEIETEMTIHALDKNFHIKELPIAYRDRPKGSFSKLNTIKDGIKVLRLIFNLYKEYKPFSFFGWLGVLLIFCVVIVEVPVIMEYLETGMVPRFPTLIVGGFGVLAAVVSFSLGIILDSMSKKYRQMYELYLNLQSKECEE